MILLNKKKLNIYDVIYMILIIVNTATISSTGYGIGSYRYWIILLTSICLYLMGIEKGDSLWR